MMYGYIGMKMVGCTYYYASNTRRDILTYYDTPTIVQLGDGSGNGYNTKSYDSGHVDGNGQFIAPANGYYFVYANASLASQNDRARSFSIVTQKLNNSLITYQSGSQNNKRADDGYTTVAISCIAKCEAGDKIYIITNQRTSGTWAGCSLGGTREKQSNCCIFLLSTY